jgi:hypothetical protein
MPDEHLAIAGEPLIDKDKAQLTMKNAEFKVHIPPFHHLTDLKAFTWDDAGEIIGSPPPLSAGLRLIPQNPDKPRTSAAGHQTWLDTLNSKNKS